MTRTEERQLYAKICYEITKMMPNDMTAAEYYAMYSQLATHFANEVTKYLYDVADEEKNEENAE